jgi:hypothetical protein
MDISKFKRFITGIKGRVFNEQEVDALTDAAYKRGVAMSRIKFSILPLPFTESQLLGREYGDFITPHGFAGTFGECNVPAPGPHGYEQRAYYVGRDDLNKGDAIDLVCHRAIKFANPADSDKLVPVIVTVLR